MKRPNLSVKEVAQYIDYAPTLIEKNIKRLVDIKRITSADADDYLPGAIMKPTEAVFALAIRGYYLNGMGKKNQNDRGLYDDAIVLIGPNFIKTYNANTDPSKSNHGLATLLPGLHYFKKGKHGISRPGGGYAAYRPDTNDEGLPVTRDGKTGIHRGIAINIHRGGEVYTNSAGCQTIVPVQWLDFQPKSYDLLTIEAQRRFPYLLIENM